MALNFKTPRTVIELFFFWKC